MMPLSSAQVTWWLSCCTHPCLLHPFLHPSLLLYPSLLPALNLGFLSALGGSEHCLSCCIQALPRWQWHWGHPWALWGDVPSGAGPCCSRLAASPAGEVSLGFCPHFLPQPSLCLFFSGRRGRGTVALCVCVCVSVSPGLFHPSRDSGQSCIPQMEGSIPSHPIPSPVPVPVQQLRDIPISWVSLAVPPWPGCPVCPQHLPGPCSSAGIQQHPFGI